MGSKTSMHKVLGDMLIAIKITPCRLEKWRVYLKPMKWSGYDYSDKPEKYALIIDWQRYKKIYDASLAGWERAKRATK